MTDIIIYGLMAVGILAVILGSFLTILWVGFRMGRQSIDRPLAPIIKPKVVPMVEEDPYYEPMHGIPQPKISTGAER